MAKKSRDRSGKRLSRAVRQKERGRLRDLSPDDQRRAWVKSEQGVMEGRGAHRVALCYPCPYEVAMSSLGYQVVYRTFNEHPGLAAERVVLPNDVARYRQRSWSPISIESGRHLGSFDSLAFSLAYDLDILGFFDLLSFSGMPMMREDRDLQDPAVIAGGPLTASNPLPLGPFVDLMVIGDAEEALGPLTDAMATARDREELVRLAADIPGVWAPSVHGDRVPATQKVTAGVLPAYGQLITPYAELSNMFLVEASRGCPRFCKFCLVRAPESPMRESVLDQVMERIPEHAPRVGFVGAAVSEWTGIREALRRVIDTGRGVGVSSLRADRLDEEFVGLLAEGGYRTMTVAADAPSQRLRNKLAKGIRTRHLVNAARLGRAAGMSRMKLYVIIGLPDEQEEDIAELVELCRELTSHLPVALGLSPLVPKLHTPLGDAPFAGIKPMEATLKRLRRELKGIAEMRSTSARWAWVEYRMSQGGQDAGLAALQAWSQGGNFAHWKEAMGAVEERGALQAAAKHQLFQAVGMR